MNPYDITPRTYDAAALHAWTREIARARDDYLDHPNGRCPQGHPCHYRLARTTR